MKDKRAKFVELAEKRVNRTIKEIRLVGNLANRHNYDYSEDDAQKILRVLEEEVKSLRGKFSADKSRRERVFSL